MGLDIRLPMGMLFGILGLLLTGFGAVSERRIYERSLGLNVNLAWGIALLVFGIVMLVLGSRANAMQRPGKSASEAQTQGAKRRHER